jgi:hypothetical protein
MDGGLKVPSRGGEATGDSGSRTIGTSLQQDGAGWLNESGSPILQLATQDVQTRKGDIQQPLVAVSKQVLVAAGSTMFENRKRNTNVGRHKR